MCFSTLQFFFSHSNLVFKNKRILVAWILNIHTRSTTFIQFTRSSKIVQWMAILLLLFYNICPSICSIFTLLFLHFLLDSVFNVIYLVVFYLLSNHRMQKSKKIIKWNECCRLWMINWWITPKTAVDVCYKIISVKDIDYTFMLITFFSLVCISLIFFVLFYTLCNCLYCVLCMFCFFENCLLISFIF